MNRRCETCTSSTDGALVRDEGEEVSGWGEREREGGRERERERERKRDKEGQRGRHRLRESSRCSEILSSNTEGVFTWNWKVSNLNKRTCKGAETQNAHPLLIPAGIQTH